MPDNTTDPLKAAKALAKCIEDNDAREVSARWRLAWTVLFVADRAAMATAIEDQHGKRIANAFRNSATVVKAMAAGYDGEMPPADVVAHVEQWAPKTWQQCTAKPIREAAVSGTLIDMDPRAVRREMDEAKAAEATDDSPQGESPEMPKELIIGTMTIGDIARAVVAIASREPQWDGMDGKQRQTFVTNVLGEVATASLELI